MDPDLDQADDDRSHFTHACGDLRPGPEPAWCGTWFVSMGRIAEGPPEFADCPGCKEAWRSGAPCPKGCGWFRTG